jgi:hypothetical protein
MYETVSGNGCLSQFSIRTLQSAFRTNCRMRCLARWRRPEITISIPLSRHRQHMHNVKDPGEEAVSRTRLRMLEQNPTCHAPCCYPAAGVAFLRPRRRSFATPAQSCDTLTPVTPIGYIGGAYTCGGSLWVAEISENMCGLLSAFRLWGQLSCSREAMGRSTGRE